MPIAESALDLLETAGRRITEPRRAVVHALQARSEGFTAEELCRELKVVGRATVYRTLRLLLETGVLCKLALQDGAPRYSLSRTGHHHHAVCVSCGTVTDFPQCTVDGLLQLLRSTTNVEIVGHRLEVYLRCQACRSSLKNES